MSEINPRIIRCPADRHYYDANKYSRCPYCANGGEFSGATTDPFAQASNPDMGGTVFPDAGIGEYGGNVGSFGKTVDPSVQMGGVTLPPDMLQGETLQNNNFNAKMQGTIIVGAEDNTSSAKQPPCVGWLIEVEGPNRGRDYRLHSGYNFIGREEGDIVIPTDGTISANKNSSIYYVLQTKKFYIAHENGKNGTLVNNVPAMGGGMELNNYDIVTIGTTRFVFLGLCGENFSWEDSERSNAK